MENPHVIPLDASTGIPMQAVKSGNDVVNIVLLPSNNGPNDIREDDDDDDDDDDNDNDGQLDSGMKIDGAIQTPVNPERLKAFNVSVSLHSITYNVGKTVESSLIQYTLYNISFLVFSETIYWNFWTHKLWTLTIRGLYKH